MFTTFILQFFLGIHIINFIHIFQIIIYFPTFLLFFSFFGWHPSYTNASAVLVSPFFLTTLLMVLVCQLFLQSAGTFTLSNLGMFGVFDAILPPGIVSIDPK